MASSLPTSVDLESLKDLAECPVCYEIPRDGVMLLCRNGHNVCATCKDQLDTSNAKCPIGRCDYGDPPTANRTVVGLIDLLHLEFPCKYTKAEGANDGCDFKGSRDMLQNHEESCEHRSVECDACDDMVPFCRIVEHFATVHDEPAKRAEDGEVKVWFGLDTQSQNFDWFETHEVNGSFVFPSVQFEGDLVYIWLKMVAHSSVTEKLKCQMTVGSAAVSSNATGPVYPIDWDREKIMQDEKCVRLSRWSIQNMLTDDVTEEEKKKGFCLRFPATFKIVNA